MITTATVIPGEQAENIGVLAQALQPLLGATAYVIFCVGLFAVAMNPFLINAIIGGSILADGLGKPARLSDRSSRVFTVAVLLVGMVVAILALRTGQKPVSLIIFGSALTVIGNPLMAATILWLANNKAIMGEHRNNLIQNILGGVGFLAVVIMAVRVLIRGSLEVSAEHPNNGRRKMNDITALDERGLEDVLSEPTDATSKVLADLSGDIVVLGAGGKMGPTLVMMLRKAAPERNIYAVSRFSDKAAQGQNRADRDQNRRSGSAGRIAVFQSARCRERVFPCRHEVRLQRQPTSDLGDEQFCAGSRCTALQRFEDRRILNRQRLSAR